MTGTADYFGVNAYTVLLLTREEKHSNTSGLDLGLRAFSSKKWKASKTSSWDTVSNPNVNLVGDKKNNIRTYLSLPLLYINHE